jgi:hypothetical protein
MTHDPRPHPFAHELAYDSDIDRDMRDEMRAEYYQKPARWCPECRNTGWHSQGCPDAEDEEDSDDDEQGENE